ncbi:MAG TPA: ADP-ribosylglycohydrolase family protein [Crinalium sp.]
MRDSLLSRFQGALLGAALGEVLGACCQIRRRKPSGSAWLDVEQWGFAPTSSSLLPDGWGKYIVAGIQQLTRTQRWDLEPLEETSPFSMKGGEQGGLAIATLPLALYFHDDLAQLQNQIQQAVAVWNPEAKKTPDLLQNVTIPAGAIALASQESLHPTCLTSDLLTNLELRDANSSAVQLLQGVQTLVGEQVSLAIAKDRLSEIAVAQSPLAAHVATVLYSFLATPDDVRLSLLQTAQLSPHPQSACALVGALSGAYNGLPGIPLGWRRALQSFPSEPFPLRCLWSIEAEVELMQLAEQLFAAWSGVYQPIQSSQTNQAPLLVASPNVIRAQ